MKFNKLFKGISYAFLFMSVFIGTYAVLTVDIAYFAISIAVIIGALIALDEANIEECKRLR